MNTLARLTLLVAILTSTACNNQLLDDPNFDLWCGDQLCSWTTEAGEIQKVSTWHPKDYGVSLVGAPVKLSQEFYGYFTSCMTFEVVGDVSASAQLTVELDGQRDGTVEYSAAVPETAWTTETFQVPVPPDLGGLTVRLHKKGNGRAILARLSIYEEGDCALISQGDGGP